MSRPRLLLFDTGCVLEVMRHGLWRELCRQYQVVVPSVVVHTEASYIDNVPGKITPIDLADEVRQGLIAEYAATPAELADALKHWPAAIRERADDGEVEALAYLRAHGTSDTAFLTADGPAIQAVVALACEGQPMSLEKLFQVTGCSRNGLEWRFTEEFVEKNRSKGVSLMFDGLAAGKDGDAVGSRKRRRRGR